MSGVILASSSRAILVSSRPSGAPRQKSRALPEREVELGFRSVDAEGVGVLAEVRRFVRGRREAHQDPGTGRDVDVADPRVDLGDPAVVQDRPVLPKDLFDRVRIAARVVDEALPLVAGLRKSASTPLLIVLVVVSCPASAIEYTMLTMSNSVSCSGLLRERRTRSLVEVVDRFCVARGDEVLDVAPHAHDVPRGRDLFGSGQLTVREQTACGSTP